MMHLVEIDMVCPQAPEAFFAGAFDMQGREARLVGPVAHPSIDLRGQNKLFASTAALIEPAADNLFGHPFADFPPIHVGAVEKIDAQFQRVVHDGKAVGFGGLRPEVHSAKAKAADANS